jgi:hypothetical protein
MAASARYGSECTPVADHRYLGRLCVSSFTLTYDPTAPLHQTVCTCWVAWVVILPQRWSAPSGEALFTHTVAVSKEYSR